MSTPLAELSTDDQEKVIRELTAAAVRLIAKNWTESGVSVPALIDEVSEETSRSHREAYYAIQYGFYRSIIEERDGLLFLGKNAKQI